MQSFLGVALVLALLSLVASQARNSSQSMELYIIQNQRQFDAKIKQLADELANVKNLFQKQLTAIDVQADSMQLKLEQAIVHLDPIILIDSWSKQCVQNYSSSIPTITVARDSIIKCKESISGIFNAPDNNYNTLNNYYKNNVKNGLAQCLKLHHTAQINYTLCVIKVIDDANKYTISTQNTFHTNLRSSECTADIRIRTSWQCSFGQVYSITTKVEQALQLIYSCISNKIICGSFERQDCPYKSYVTLAEINPLNDTILNPFKGVTNDMKCLEFQIKR
ncbi:uncharacterized protein LOC6549607 [Drosophila erecta]|uniref:Protein TsetseEP domain-containing protein n=1 Tax=Drosophila erecta TaxID=7220 RepID=B3NRI8_DROER|nr:uncharacterized protein LOC6549607 [Drosophila erecta]EDV56140.2 uncharacterized protein Dere_GG22479 [Drosophila erecta]